MLAKMIGAALVCSMALGFSGFAHAEDTLAKIRRQGYVSVGVRTDSPPWGALDPSGQPVGLEVDLGAALATRLGVAMHPVVVQSSNRIQFLQQGQIDMIIATMYDTPERRRVVDMVQPRYSSAATNILAPKSQHFTTWQQLQGKTVCGQQGSTFNRWLAQKYEAHVIALPTVEEDYAALRAGNCVAFVYNDQVLSMALEGGKVSSQDYELPLTAEDREYHAVGVRRGEADSPFGQQLSAALIGFVKDGTLTALNKKWGVPADPLLQQLSEKYH